MDQTNDYRSYFFVAGLPSLISAIIIFPLRFMKRVEDAKNDFNEQLCSKTELDLSPKCFNANEKLSMLFETSV